MMDDELLDILACPACVREVVLVDLDREGYEALVGDAVALVEKATALDRQRRFSGHQWQCKSSQFGAIRPPRTGVTDPGLTVGQVQCAGCGTVFTLVPTGILPPQAKPREDSEQLPVRLVKEEEDMIVCLNPLCGKRYPIRDEIPVMLIEEAQDPTIP